MKRGRGIVINPQRPEYLALKETWAKASAVCVICGKVAIYMHSEIGACREHKDVAVAKSVASKESRLRRAKMFYAEKKQRERRDAE